MLRTDIQHTTYIAELQVTTPAYLEWLPGIFRDAPRAEMDGVKAVVFSDEMALMIAADLQKIAAGEGVLSYEA